MLKIRHADTREDGDLELKRHLVIPAAIAIIIYCVLAVLVYGPTNPLGAAHMPDGGIGDPSQMVWFLAWTPFAIFHGHSLLSTNYLDFPFGINLADNTGVPILGLLAAPITHFFGPIASLNGLLRLAFAASATSMFFVLRSYCKSLIACFVGGLLYGFGPYIVSQGQQNAHLNLAFVAMPPILFWCLDQLIFRRKYRALPLGALFGVSAAIQYLIAPEILSDCVVVALPIVIVVLIVRWSVFIKNIVYFAKATLSLVVTFFILASYSIINLIAGSGHVTGSVQPTAHLQTFSSDLLSPIIPNARQWLTSSSLTNIALHFVSRNPSEQGGYLGITLIIAGLICVAIWRRERFIQIVTALALIAFIASLGSHLTVKNHHTTFPLPEDILTHLPLLKDTTPARFAMQALLFTAAIVAFGLDRALTAARGKSPQQMMVSCSALFVGVVIVVAPVIPATPLSIRPLPWSGALVTELKTQVPRGSVVLTYPYPSPPFSEAMIWQAETGMAFKLLGGYATVRTSDGSGQYWPIALEPAAVQEYLNTLEAGPHSHYPAAPTGTSAARDSLCLYVKNNHVTDLVLWTRGPNALAAMNYFNASFGQPTATSPELDVWQNVQKGVSASGTCTLKK